MLFHHLARELRARRLHRILAALRDDPDTEPDTIVQSLAKTSTDATDPAALNAVWAKLQTFPHLFEVAAARDCLADYDLSGNPMPNTSKITISNLRFQGWDISLREVDASYGADPLRLTSSNF